MVYHSESFHWNLGNHMIASEATQQGMGKQITWITSGPFY